MFLFAKIIMAKDKSRKCLICRQPAKAIYYEVLSCAGCRAFYQRTASCRKKYSCEGDGHCPMMFDLEKAAKDQKWCRACRYQRYTDLMTSARIENGLPRQSVRSSRLKHSSVNDVYSTSVYQYLRDQIDNSLVCPVIKVTDDIKEQREQYDSIPSEQLIPQEVDEQDENAELTSEKKINMASASNSRQLFSPSILPCPGPSFAEPCPIAAYHESYRAELAKTVRATSSAVTHVFAEDISNSWSACRKPSRLKTLAKISCSLQSDKCGEPTSISDNDVENCVRLQSFISLLPGVGQLDTDVQHCLLAHWKVSLCSLISMYSTSANIKELELDQTERCLLMAVIMLEPDETSMHHMELTALHRHYANALSAACR